MSVRRLVVAGEAADPITNNFDALRLAMALFVIWSHSFAIHCGSEKGEWLSLALHGAYNAGNVGVMAFFVISGFLITQSYERSRSKYAYFLKRVRRIYPGYLVATTISACLFLHFIAPTATVTGSGWLRMIGMNLFLQSNSPVPNPQGYVHGGLLSINGALWSIPYEFWCYIAVALFGALRLLRIRWFLVLALIFIMVVHVSLRAMRIEPGLGIVGLVIGVPSVWTTMAPCFLLGMIAYTFRATLPRNAVLLVLLISATVVGCWTDDSLGFLLFLPSLAYTVFYVSFADGIPFHNAAKYGDFSYGTYLYGFLIQMTLQFTIGRNWSLATFFLVSAALALVAGALSWHFVEKWFLPRRQQCSKRHDKQHLIPEWPSGAKQCCKLRS
ncbi:MAG TPA: acyltransferase [Sphingomicrobium sp.]|nr:acyltransferase [Sphingomicrobium sp.]